MIIHNAKEIIKKSLDSLPKESFAKIKRYLVEDIYETIVTTVDCHGAFMEYKVMVFLENSDKSIILYCEGEDDYGCAMKERGKYVYVSSGADILHLFSISEII